MTEETQPVKRPGRPKKTEMPSLAEITQAPMEPDTTPVLATPAQHPLDPSVPVGIVRRRENRKITIPRYEDLEMVRGVFHNHEHPKCMERLPLRLWKGPIKFFDLWDNQEYVVPKIVADHINQCYYIRDEYRSDDGTSMGNVIMTRPPAGGRGITMPGWTKKKIRHFKRFTFNIQGRA